MGKGARKDDNSSYEHNCKTHGAPLGGDAYKNTMVNLGADPENPFVIFDDVKELYAKRAEELKGIVKCANPKCITNNEPMKTYFHAVPGKEGVLRCHYCNKEVDLDHVKLV